MLRAKIWAILCTDNPSAHLPFAVSYTAHTAWFASGSLVPTILLYSSFFLLLSPNRHAISARVFSFSVTASCSVCDKIVKLFMRAQTSKHPEVVGVAENDS